MLLNTDLRFEFKDACYQAGTTPAEIARKIEINRQDINGVFYRCKRVVNPVLVAIWEALGYDIRLEFVKRSDGGEDK